MGMASEMMMSEMLLVINDVMSIVKAQQQQVLRRCSSHILFVFNLKEQAWNVKVLYHLILPSPLSLFVCLSLCVCVSASLSVFC